MTLTAIATTIALIAGYLVGTAVTIAWTWERMRKVHRRYKKGARA